MSSITIGLNEHKYSCTMVINMKDTSQAKTRGEVKSTVVTHGLLSPHAYKKEVYLWRLNKEVHVMPCD